MVEKKDKKGKRTKEKLLEIATRLFAERGFAGTTVDAIVNEARINKRMVYHYFGSKERLYQASLRLVFGRLGDIELELSEHKDGLEALLASIIKEYFHFLQTNSEFVKLLLWENLNQGHGIEGAQLTEVKNPILTKLNEAIQRGIDEGKLRSNLDARHLLINLIGLCLIYFSNRHTLSQSLSMDLGAPETLDEGIDHIIKLVQEGIHAGEKEVTPL